MNSSHNSISSQLCATEVMDVLPAVMQWIHKDVRMQKTTCLTIPQLRALAFLQNNPSSSLVVLAEYLGVTSASTSTMVERLVQKEFVTRNDHPTTRRQVVLSLTVAGKEHLQQVRQITCDRLAQKLDHLSSDQLTILMKGLEDLSHIAKKELASTN